MTKDDYLVYNADLDRFITVYKLKRADFAPFFEKLRERARKTTFGVGDYRAHIVKKFVADAENIIKQAIRDNDADSKAEQHEVASFVVNSLAANVEQTYPFLGVASISDALNSQLDNEEEERIISESAAKIDSLASLAKLEKAIKKRIIGQDEAVSEMIRSIKLKSAGLNTFTTHFFIGPTGVGKTELCKVLSEEYLGSRKKLVKINCGEYSSSHEYAKLLGSPPGYVGHQEKGFLSERAEESNEWILLFDEIEKAHPKVHNVLLNLLDEGTITDSQGNILDFSNSIIVMTSNIGVREFVGKKSVGFGNEDAVTYENARENIEAQFKQHFSPEFINRIQSTIYFNELSEENAKEITKILLRDFPVFAGVKLVNSVTENGYSQDYGARNIRRYILSDIAPILADAMLTHGKDKTFKAVFDKDGKLSEFVPKETENKGTELDKAALL